MCHQQQQREPKISNNKMSKQSFNKMDYLPVPPRIQKMGAILIDKDDDIEERGMGFQNTLVSFNFRLRKIFCFLLFGTCKLSTDRVNNLIDLSTYDRYCDTLINNTIGAGTNWCCQLLANTLRSKCRINAKKIICHKKCLFQSLAPEII